MLPWHRLLPFPSQCRQMYSVLLGHDQVSIQSPVTKKLSDTQVMNLGKINRKCIQIQCAPNIMQINPRDNPGLAYPRHEFESGPRAVHSIGPNEAVNARIAASCKQHVDQKRIKISDLIEDRTEDRQNPRRVQCEYLEVRAPRSYMLCNNNQTLNPRIDRKNHVGSPYHGAEHYHQAKLGLLSFTLTRLFGRSSLF